MSLLSERHLMTVVINIHRPYFIFKIYVMSWLWCHVSLMHTPSSKVLPTFLMLEKIIFQTNAVLLNLGKHYKNWQHNYFQHFFSSKYYISIELSLLRIAS